MPQIFIKAPDDILDYVENWATWLGTDTIETSTWTVPTGITKDSDTFTSTTCTIWLSSGTAGRKYSIKNKITTAGGRTKARWIEVMVRQT